MQGCSFRVYLSCKNAETELNSYIYARNTIFFSCEYASVDYCEIWNWEQENKVNNWGNNNAFSIWLWRFFFYNFLFTCSFIMYLLASKTLEATHSNLKLNFSCTLKRIQTLRVHIYPFVFNGFRYCTPLGFCLRI